MGIIGAGEGISDLHETNQIAQARLAQRSFEFQQAQAQAQARYHSYLSQQAQSQQSSFSNSALGGLGQAQYRIDPLIFSGIDHKPEDLKKQKKAENKSVLLLQNMIGAEQCDIYRARYKIVLKPGKHTWIIGNIFNRFNAEFPFRDKPDVIRIDNFRKRHYTDFCVDSADRQNPYTDKVISFCCHLMTDERKFFNIINRIKEDTLTDIPICAKWLS